MDLLVVVAGVRASSEGVLLVATPVTEDTPVLLMGTVAWLLAAAAVGVTVWTEQRPRFVLL